MRRIKYTLMPDVAGAFVTKEAPLSEFARDVRWVFYRKNIPPLSVLNAALAHGWSPREAEWEPFSLHEIEFQELLDAIAGEPPLGFRFLQPPPNIQTHEAWLHWIEAQQL